jgi:hypothetical protein
MRYKKLILFFFLIIPVWAAATGFAATGGMNLPLPGETHSGPGMNQLFTGETHSGTGMNQLLPGVTRTRAGVTSRDTAVNLNGPLNGHMQRPLHGRETGIQASDKITELRARFDSGDAFTAFMTHEYVDSFTSDTVVTTGTIWIGTVSYKVVTDQQLVTVDGSVSKVYNRLQNKLIISFYDPEEDDFAPSRFLAGTQERYVVQEEVGDDDTIITLTSDDPFEMFRMVRIYLTENGIPWLITGIDQTDNEFSTRFESGVFIPATEDLFDISWPGSAEIVDLRN